MSHEWHPAAKPAHPGYHSAATLRAAAARRLMGVSLGTTRAGARYRPKGALRRRQGRVLTMNIAPCSARVRLALVLLTFSALFAACGLIPYRTARNEPICPHTVITGTALQTTSNCRLMGSAAEITRYPVSRAREHFNPADNDVPPVFVGLALSGGGSRAANFPACQNEVRHLSSTI